MEAVLGFDTSTATLSVAVAAGGAVRAERTVGPDEAGRPRHAPGVLEAIEQVLGESGGWEAIGKIVVGIGPGTFTGLRIGVSTARALGQARNLPVIGVSSLAALGAGAGEQPALAVIDARRDEVFTAFGAEWEPAVEAPERLAARIGELGTPPVAVGDGAIRYRTELQAAGAEVPGDDDERHLVNARFVCELAESGSATEPVPAYLRRPDAELWRERQAAGGAA